MTAVPIYEPADDAIPAPEVPALSSINRPFVQEITILQRERDQTPRLVVHRRLDSGPVLHVDGHRRLTWGAGRLNNAVNEPEPVEEKRTIPKAA